MAKLLQLRRGTTSQHSSFTGAVGEVTVDTDKDVVVVHDGSTAGGKPMQPADAVVTELATMGSTTASALADLTQAEAQILDGATVSTAELNYNDTGAAVGTVVASKTVTVDTNKDTSGFRNVTLTGELDAATLDISGNADIDGTTNLDAVDIDGTVQIDGATTFGVDDTGVDVKFHGATASAYALWDESADDLILAGAAGLVVPEGQLTLGSTAVTSNAAEINTLDGVTAGTVIASKAVVTDANIDITGGRNITITGELDAATLDISGNADIDGTTNLDAVDIDGAVQVDSTITVGVDDTGYDVKFFGDTASAYCLWDTSADDLILGGAAGLVVPEGQLTLGSTAVTSTAAELNLVDGITAGTVSASKALIVDANKDLTGLNDVTIGGNLTVNGTTTTIDTTNLTVEDPLISLAKNNNSSNTVDIGFYGLYDATGSQDVYTGLFRDANDSGKWKLFELNQAAPTTTVDTSGTGYTAATLVVGTLEDSKGNVRNIPASTNTTLVASDAGKHISITAGITINASTDFAVGDAVTIFNNQAAGNDETITATGIDLYLATDPSVSGATNRTLAPRGVATILCVAADKYVITGAGLT